MLDQAILNQLKTVYAELESEMDLRIYSSDHAKQGELVEMLNSLATTSERLKVTQLDTESDAPSFEIYKNGEATGISFLGIPGGHEFTSLVLAVLNADGKGKLPDQGILNRMKSLKGPIQLKTYISLSCENCPDVVQALNIMSAQNENFSHQMVDGEFRQDEIEALKIQGVPSVVDGKNNEVLSVGKTTMAELLEKLEAHFGADDNEGSKDLGDYEVIVVGGGPAGASAAIYSARKGLKTGLISENIGGQVKDTKGIENLISVSYTEGPQLSAQLAKHMADYPIEIFEHRRVESIVKDEIKTLILNSGEVVRTKSLIITTGAKWRELNIPGEKDYMGRGVGFCPHCDGPFFKGRDVAVIGGGNSGVEAAIDLAGIVKSVTLFEFMPELKADKVLVDKMLSLPNVKVIKNARTAEVLGNGDKVTGLRYEDRASGEMIDHEIAGIFIQIGFMPNSAFVKDHVNTNKFGEIEIDDKCRTNVKGIYAAGDVTTVPFKQIVISMGEGAKAALTAFEEQKLHG